MDHTPRALQIRIATLMWQIVAEGEITNKWEQWADLWADIRKVSVLIEPVLLEDQEDSMLYREVMRTGIAA